MPFVSSTLIVSLTVGSGRVKSAKTRGPCGTPGVPVGLFVIVTYALLR